MVGPESFQDPDYRRLFQALIETGGRRDLEGRWLLAIPEELAAEVESIGESAEHFDWTGARTFFVENIDHLLARPVAEKFRALVKEAPAGDEVNDEILARISEAFAMRRQLRMKKRDEPPGDGNKPPAGESD